MIAPMPDPALDMGLFIAGTALGWVLYTTAAVAGRIYGWWRA